MRSDEGVREARGGAPPVRILVAAPRHAAGIRRVHEAAFGQPDEADIVAALVADCDDLVSLVAVAAGDDTVVGHILFSPVECDGEGGSQLGMGLGPMAVTPALQRCGVGSRLVAAGLAILRDRECPYVVVLGHPQYYPRFGFQPAARIGLRCEWDVPEDVFMVLPLRAGVESGLSGTVRYRHEFGPGS